jgi:ribose-phosphate pyrophosphokinase
MQARVPISAADVARLLEYMGVDRVVAVDLHCGQIQGFFGPLVPVDNLDGGIVASTTLTARTCIIPSLLVPMLEVSLYGAKKFKEGLERRWSSHDCKAARSGRLRRSDGPCW